MTRFATLRLGAFLAIAFAPTWVAAAEVDARPPDRLTLSAQGSRLVDAEEDGRGGSLSWLHYFTPDALVGLGAEHQTIAESQWSFGSVRGAWGTGDSASRFSVFGEVHHGKGDEDGRDFDYSVAVLGLSKALTRQLSVQLEGRQIDIDRSRGNLPKLGLTFVWSPRVVTNISYAHSVGGNLGTELITARLDTYARAANFILGGAFGEADPSVINLQPGLSSPAQDLRQGFLGIGRTFSRGEILLLGDYLVLDESEKVTLTLSFTAYLGRRR